MADIDSSLFYEAAAVVRDLGFTFLDKDILTPSRDAHIVMCRALMAITLRKNGATLKQSATVLNMHHASINHFEKHYRGGQNRFDREKFKNARNLISNNLADVFAMSQIRYHEDQILKWKEKLKNAVK